MKLEVVILAAGQGTRMKSRLPKVLHTVAGIPLLEHVVRTAVELNPVAVHVVVGHGADQVKTALAPYNLHWITQEQQLGTGHAVLQALPSLQADSIALILYGDVPLTPVTTLASLVDLAQTAPALLTAVVTDPHGYGRILRDSSGELLGVVEHKDATAAQRDITEINTGVLAAPVEDFARYLPLVDNNNQQGEFYLPDILPLAVAENRSVASYSARNELDILGVNDRVQLNLVEREYQHRYAQQLLLDGVSLADSSRIDVRGDLQCGADVSIDINAVFEGNVILGDDVVIGPNCVLRDVVVGDGTVIHAMSHLQETKVGAGCSVGPFARLRPGTVLADGARVGNFVEIKKSNIGAGSKVNHLSYIGDCEMGEGVNVGAGTITCNYDGVNKHLTEIGNGAFIGSNSTLVAPIKISEQGFVGAGSTLTADVGSEELAVSRARQRNIQGWRRPGTQKNRD